MRIIAGQFRGLALASVGKGDAGAHLRPTSDRVRESLFNILTKYDVFDGARVLDLFAGTGALGLEALSRGAAQVCFVDDGAKAGQLIRQNIALTGSGAQTRLIRRDARKLPANEDAPYDLVFLDPPYGKDLGARALDAARAGGWIGDDAMIVWEDSTPQPAPDGFSLLDQRKYGATHITILQAD
ncbi:Ribosomal RNA small subunit methyltransferase D (plasmid) [Pseudoseohaeicola sp. NH-UV-7]|uniref:16S rRNA (guanine(966)-N(2))-methyltransferase RsmD n=1 Tax=unclassified Sulfitobacter TaxID=196795 RepID=UPI000E0A11B8|nr:16S rRNA (guanine(966)-N(2))-methyltransferase RsmD [Sulfitobacter sp. JL08]AXI56367.1 16S rRNA (guanine(966)-N(2))-methyltransferase RsmD [Sulfitobacter sp. JL08]